MPCPSTSATRRPSSRLADGSTPTWWWSGPRPARRRAVDACVAAGRLAFGPGAGGARLEGSKAYMKQVLADAGVPTARHATFAADDARPPSPSSNARRPVRGQDRRAGRREGGASSPSRSPRPGTRSGPSSRAPPSATPADAWSSRRACGPELSLLVLCDGARAVPLAPAQDFKRLGDGDPGPNTGGMGAYSPVPVAGRGRSTRSWTESVEPDPGRAAPAGHRLPGVLYAGLMLTPPGPRSSSTTSASATPKCRWSCPASPATSARSCAEAAAGELTTRRRWRPRRLRHRGVAAEGYPRRPARATSSRASAAAAAIDGVLVFHAGTRRRRRRRSSPPAGGSCRVTGSAPTLAARPARAYEAAARSPGPACTTARDIAHARSLVPPSMIPRYPSPRWPPCSPTRPGSALARGRDPGRRGLVGHRRHPAGTTPPPSGRGPAFDVGRHRGAGAGHRPRRGRLRRRRQAAVGPPAGDVGPLRPHVVRRRRHRPVRSP